MYIKEKIKIVIWDLDDTFWSGNFEENSLQFIEKNIEILNILNNRGIINSICSKNDFEKIRNLLKEKQIWDLFVFPSINYSPKGSSVKQILEKAQLRAENAIFIDDNIVNLNEVKFYNPNINVASPKIWWNITFGFFQRKVIR